MRKLVAGLVLAGTTVVAGLTGVAPAHAEDGLDYAGYVRFERAVASDVDAYWARRVGEDYQSPRLVLAAKGHYAESACGAPAGDPDAEHADASPAFECPRDDTVYLSSAWTYRELYEKFGDFAAAVAIAHEWAHHAQLLIGSAAKSTMQLELQADCWAGVWGRDADGRGLVEAGDLDEAARALYAMGDYEYTAPDHHGTPAQRRAAFKRGYAAGDPGGCPA
jgi:predicted metalloprotease